MTKSLNGGKRKEWTFNTCGVKNNLTITSRSACTDVPQQKRKELCQRKQSIKLCGHAYRRAMKWFMALFVFCFFIPHWMCGLICQTPFMCVPQQAKRSH